MMSHPECPANALTVAEAAARAAGAKLRAAFHDTRDVDEMKAYDIKLALDRECQELIASQLLAAFPDHCMLGEEGNAGNESSPWRWIVDPLDGTVNYFYGIPHFSVSIGLSHGGMREGEEGSIRIGAVHDPMLDETWTVQSGGPAMLNGEPTQVSARDSLGAAIVTVGFSKSPDSIDHGLARFKEISHRVRKTRMMGSAALAMAYIASGRLDAYIEEEVSLWDIAAGKLLVEAAGGEVLLTPCAHPSAPGKYSICASNGRVPVREYAYPAAP